MKLFLTVKARSRKEEVIKINETHYKIFVKEPAEKGKANTEIIKVLASYLNISPSKILLISGLTSKEKVIEILH